MTTAIRAVAGTREPVVAEMAVATIDAVAGAGYPPPNYPPPEAASQGYAPYSPPHTPPPQGVSSE